jgi:hypothetical protein
MERKFRNNTYWLLAEAWHRGLIVPFIGAGVSNAIRGTPLWGECVKKLIAEIKDDANRQNSELEYFELLEKNADLLFVAEQCKKYLQKPMGKDFYNSFKTIILQQTQSNLVAQKGLELFLKMPSYRIITTNYDNLLLDTERWLDPIKKINSLTHKNCDEFPRFLRSGDNRWERTIFYLHGHLDDPDSIIFSESDYQKLYTNEKVLDLLQAIFFSKSALFIGFSLKDDDVMWTFRQLSGKFPSPYLRHFAIFPRQGKKEAECALEALRLNYKYGVGVLYYDDVADPDTNERSHDQLWELIRSLHKDVDAPSPEKAAPGRIAIILDEGFSYGEAMDKIVEYMNGIQAEIKYTILPPERVKVDLKGKFIGVDENTKEPAFTPVIEYSKAHEGKYDGFFVFTEEQEDRNYYFFNRKRFGWASAWFWKNFIAHRPTIDEYLRHVLVLLTLYFYDAKVNKYSDDGIGKSFLEPHWQGDIGCLFDGTAKLQNRVAIVDYPKICPEHQTRLREAFQGKKINGQEINLGPDWVRRVMPLAK